MVLEAGRSFSRRPKHTQMNTNQEKRRPHCGPDFATVHTFLIVVGAKKWSHIFATFETEVKIFAMSDTSFPGVKNNAKSTANSTAKSKAAKKAKCKAKAKLRTTLLAK